MVTMQLFSTLQWAFDEKNKFLNFFMIKIYFSNFQFLFQWMKYIYVRDGARVILHRIENVIRSLKTQNVM